MEYENIFIEPTIKENYFEFINVHSTNLDLMNIILKNKLCGFRYRLLFQVSL